MSAARTEHDRPQLTLFGGPLLQRSPGVPVLLTPSHERLLALVWGHEDRGISRTSAIWLLWEEEDAPRSRQRLRQLLHDLGTRLGFRPLASHGEGRLVPGSGLVASDLDHFHHALTAHDLTKALSLFRLGFASRLDGRTGGEEYEDWLLAKREALRRMLREAAARAWDQARPAGAWERALDAAEVLAALDPGNEATVTKLVEARAVTGRILGAQQAACDFLAGLPSGTHPTREAAALFDRVRDMGPAPIVTGPSNRAQPPLVGRRHALQVARGALDRVAMGSFEFLLFRGEGGAGKTRLMEEVRREADVAGFRCLGARPVELERRIPLNPLVDMLGDPSVAPHIRGLDEPWRAVIASLLPTLPAGMDPPVVPPIAETSLSRRLYDAFATLFAAMADSGPHLLFLDDLHWADATTVAVLQFVQRRWRSGPLGVVAAIRPELISGSDEVARYLSNSGDLPVTAVELDDLTEGEARTLLDLVAGTELDAPAADRLLALGGRNPFYLIELTRDFVAGKVQLPELPTEAITLPISLRQLLEPRIQELGDAAANVAAHLAVWGRAITLPELALLTRSSLEDAAGSVEELERCRLATVEVGQVSLGHELFRSTIYQSLTATRRSLLHGRVAEFLNEQDGQQPGETAIHFARAGHAAGAARRGREAADRALESGAMAEAAYFLQLVVENVGDATLKAEATADLAKVLHMNREITRANPMLELAASRLRAVGRHDRALRMDIRRVEGLAEVGAAPLSDLLDRLATIKSLARSANDDEALALALDSELHLLHRSGRVTEIRALFDEIRPVTGSPDRAAACLANAALALNVLFGDADEALRCAREAVRIAEAGEGSRHRLECLNRLFLVLLYLGRARTPEGATTLARARQLSVKSGDLLNRFQIESNQGVAEMDAGDLDDASQSFASAAGILRGAQAAVMRLNHQYNLGELAYFEGDYPTALEHFRASEQSLGPSVMPADIRFLVNAAIGLCSVELGAFSEARRREEAVRAFQEAWHFDPTLPLTFSVRLLERRASLAEAYAALNGAMPEVRLRFPVAWLKLLPLEARLARRLRKPNWGTAVQAGISLAQELRLITRARILEDVLRV
ncbi:MAG TPA: AAA family ATPase [Longimicrobiales bacterium]|nr:AAA family ATPase [Longimicrobiales bacterium]